MEVVVLLIGALIGGVISWVITHRYAKKSTNELRSISEQQKVLIKNLSSELKEVNTLAYFEKILESSEWFYDIIDGTEIYMADIDRLCQIHINDKRTSFSEDWAEVYPDNKAFSYQVLLKIGETVIKKMTFISVDGARIFVPMPDRDYIGGKFIYSWKFKSIEIKVCNIIGRYYIYNDLSGIAKHSKIEIIDN